MNTSNAKLRGLKSLVAMVLLVVTIGFSFIFPANADSLYVGDQGDNTIKRFDADTGAFLGAFVKKSNAGLKGPRGLVFNVDGDLVVSDQNALTSAHGDILLYSGENGKLVDAIVPDDDPNAPAVPRGIVLSNDTLFVADFTAEANKNKPVIPGRLLAYTSTGDFIANLTPDPSDFPATLPAEFHPRGEVFGLDGLLYVSNVPNLVTGLGGQVLRFNPDGSFHDVFINDAGGVGKLNRPEGLVFGPDGNLYITSFRNNNFSDPNAVPDNTDMIRIYDGDTADFIGKIDLFVVGAPRRFAQALLFGPGDCLFVSINNTGEIRRYDVGAGSCAAASPYDSFVAPGQGLLAPWFLTFGNTDSATLEYQ